MIAIFVLYMAKIYDQNYSHCNAKRSAIGTLRTTQKCPLLHPIQTFIYSTFHWINLDSLQETTVLFFPYPNLTGGRVRLPWKYRLRTRASALHCPTFYSTHTMSSCIRLWRGGRENCHFQKVVVEKFLLTFFFLTNKIHQNLKLLGLHCQ